MLRLTNGEIVGGTTNGFILKLKENNEIIKLNVYPEILFIDKSGTGSGVVFRATSKEAGNISFSIADPAGNVVYTDSRQTTFNDPEHIARLSWWGQPDLPVGSYTVTASIGGSSKTASFSVKSIDLDLTGLGKWMKHSKDPSAILPPKADVDFCPFQPWEELIKEKTGDVVDFSISDPVNTSSGNFVLPAVDFTLKDRRSFSVARIYNSLDPKVTLFGRGWSSPLLVNLEIAAENVVFTNSDGSRLLFNRNGNTFTPVSSTDLKLEYNADTEFYTLSHPHGTSWIFNSLGQIVQMLRSCCGQGAADAIVFSYDNSNRLSAVTTPSGRSLSFTFNGDNLITAINDSTGRTFSYAYDADKNLVSFKDALNREAVYTYNEDGFMTGYTLPGNRSSEITYADHRVTSVKDPTGAHSVFTWDLDNHKLSLTDFAGVVHEYACDADWRIVSYSVPAAAMTKGFTAANGRLAALSDSLGNSDVYSYDENGQYHSHTDKLGNITTFTWHPTLKKLTGKTDALGRTWSYEWCARGNLIRETDPAGNITRYTYDSHNNRTSKTDPLGRVTRYVYDSTGNYLIQTIDAMGGISSFTYDLRGNMLTSTDALGRTTVYQYDLLDRLVKTTYPDGRYTQVIYDEAGNIASRKDNLNRTTAYTYDAAGRMLSTTRPDGSVLSHAYDASGRKISSTDALGRITGYEYDALDNLVKVTYPDQSCQTYVYDTEKRLISSSDELGNVTAYEYDPMGRMLATIDPAGARYESTYDVAGRKVAARDPLGRTTTWAYDVLDRVTKTTAPDQTFSLSAYDVVGNLLISTNALNQQTVYEYDALNRQIKTTRPGGAQFVTAYDAGGQIVSETDALGNTTFYSYDAGGRRVATTRADGKQFTSVYDTAGRLVKTIDPLNASSTVSYDIMDRAVAETDALGRTSRYEYDAGGKRIAKIDPMGRRSLYGYDTRDRLTTEVDAEGRMVSHAYDAAGRKTGLTDGAGRIWRWVYDAVGRVIAEIDPLGHQVKSSYDLAGNPVLKTNARNQATGYEYDLMNRLVKINYPDATAATFSYDALGRELVRSGAAGAVEKSYDLAGNMVSEKFINHNKAWNYSFDLMGNRIQAISPENETFRFSYDSLGRLLNSEASATGIISRVYDGIGRVVEERRPGSITRSSYDTAGQLLEVRHDSVNAEGQPQLLLSLRQYVYDAAGNRLSMKDEDGRLTTYAYDDSNWLIRVDYPNGQIIKYAYNGAGDRVSEQIGNDVVLTSSYDAAGRLLSRGSDTFGYDADGNLINAVEGEIPASYSWNSDNRLTMVSRVHNGCKHDKDRNGYGYGHLKHGSSFVEYEKYDYLPEDWRRITRTAGVQKTAKNKNPAVEEEVFVSVYDGSDESHEYRLLTGKAASLQLEQSYISDPGTDDMNFTLSAGKTLSMLKDGLGSTVSLTGNDGKVLAKIGYDAWGRFLWPTEAEDGSFDRNKDDWSDYLNRLDKTRSFGKHNAWAFGKQFADRLTPYLYTGRRFSAMTGEYWNRHRYYSPALGRFISKDPIGFNGGMNLYRYADNNPVLLTDAYGLFTGVEEAIIITELAALAYLTIDYFQSDKWAKVKQDIGAGYNWTKENIQDAYHGITCQFLPDDAAQRIYLASQEGSSDDNPPQIDSSEAGQPNPDEDPDKDPDKDPDEWKNTSPSRPLEKMGHAQKHANEFREIDSSLSNNDIARILEYVRRTGRVVPGAGQHGGQLLEKVVTIRGKNVVVQVFETVSKTIKTGYPLLK
ncbi:MAG TPA: RHS repeat-associated core domain-containing protein [Candidatus Rifleibacterium sp.]|nr:RHS repeat-associated core domain-containing protein [Candidatus Rifleibacterium sp.]